MSEINAILTLFKKLDANRDLKLSTEEVKGSDLEKWFAFIDSNEDGSLDPTEWFKYKGETNYANISKVIFSNDIYVKTEGLLEKVISGPYDKLGLLMSLGEYLGMKFVGNHQKVSKFFRVFVEKCG